MHRTFFIVFFFEWIKIFFSLNFFWKSEESQKKNKIKFLWQSWYNLSSQKKETWRQNHDDSIIHTYLLFLINWKLKWKHGICLKKFAHFNINVKDMNSGVFYDLNLQRINSLNICSWYSCECKMYWNCILKEEKSYKVDKKKKNRERERERIQKINWYLFNKWERIC